MVLCPSNLSNRADLKIFEISGTQQRLQIPTKKYSDGNEISTNHLRIFRLGYRLRPIYGHTSAWRPFRWLCSQSQPFEPRRRINATNSRTLMESRTSNIVLNNVDSENDQKSAKQIGCYQVLTEWRIPDINFANLRMVTPLVMWNTWLERYRNMQASVVVNNSS